MEEKYFVIQWKHPKENSWQDFPEKYPTLIAAREGAKRGRYRLGRNYRIAEATVTVRYKPVKVYP